MPLRSAPSWRRPRRVRRSITVTMRPRRLIRPWTSGGPPGTGAMASGVRISCTRVTGTPNIWPATTKDTNDNKHTTNQKAKTTDSNMVFRPSFCWFGQTSRPAGERASGGEARGRTDLPDSVSSGRLDVGEECLDQVLQVARLARESARCAQHLAGNRAGVIGGLRHAADVRRHLLRALGSFFDVARDLLRRRALLFDGRGNGGGDLVDLADRLADGGDRFDRVLRRRLHGVDLRRDVLGGLRGLRGEVLHLGRDDRETLAGFTRTRRFDRGVEREKVGLVCDLVDQRDDLADLGRGADEALYLLVGPAGLGHGAGRDLAGVADLAAGLRDRRRQLFRGGRDGLHIGRALLRRGGNRGGLLGRLLSGGAHGLGRALHLRRLRSHGLHDGADAGLESASQLVQARAALLLLLLRRFLLQLQAIAFDHAVLVVLLGCGLLAVFVL